MIIGKVGSNHSWYATYLRKLVSSWGLNNYIKFTGFVPKEKIPLYINAADVFTLSSYAEGAPLVVPQAMACVRVVVATHNAHEGYEWTFLEEDCRKDPRSVSSERAITA